ncbi:methyl-accepting chemotaxis protein [Desulfosporosinus shakirovi]|uniref:methyl-accepting chemotaxis protein n=1 Tax=Desulfosporosinus shakirovi TaxID=2885154 RepID=UPI001E46F303|nr:methyl-accepting chemotaxis protein [Desulfosporosinus sp. SRJS8]MCB8815228.1 methyl-accepting chemotaxis protein [Desulfosporosinus sp. SRJS8]
MKAKYLKDFIECIPNFLEVMQDDLSISVYDIPQKKIIALEGSGKLSKDTNKVGDPFIIEERPLLNAVKNEKKQLISLPPVEHGTSMKLLLTPVLNEEDKVEAIVAVSKSLESERKIENISATLSSSIVQLSSGIQEIASNSQMLSSVIKEIADFGEQTQMKISEINGIINEIKKISSHSNLLALNASIEAARAGEAGRGFDVVAKEMGKFSTLSKTSADKVAKSLLEMKEAIETISTKISDTSLASENQAAATEEIAATSDDIVGVVRQLSDFARIDSAEETIAKIQE